MEFFLILWRMLKPFRKEFALFLLVAIVYEGLQILDSYLLSLVIELLSRQLENQLVLFALFFVAVLIFDELFLRLDNDVDWRIIAGLLNPIYRYLKQHTLRKFLAMEMRWHHQQRSGALMGKVQDGTGKILDMTAGICWEFAPTFIQGVLSIVPLLFISPWAALILSVALAVFWAITLRQHEKQSPFRKARHDGYETEWGKAQEFVSNVETVVLYNQDKRLIDDYEGVLETIESSTEKEARLGLFRYGRWRMRTIAIGRRAILALLAWQVFQGILSVALMVFAWTLTERLFHAFWRIARIYDRAAQSLEAAQRLERVMALEPAIVDPRQVKSMREGPVDLVFRNVSFSYGEENAGIHNLTLTIRGGETVGIVGPSGAGKTTLRRLLTRSWDVDEGEIHVNGVDIRDLSLATLRELFSHVPQGDEASIFNETFAFNIAFGRPGATQEEIAQAGKVAGIHDFIAGCKDGYETRLGEKGLRLSGGQKQRVALARAILAQRPVLILDEATSSVDSIHEDEIQQRLLPILKDTKRTVIIIAHRLSTIWNVADRILVFNNGELVEEGPHAELIKQNGLYAELFSRQTKHALEVNPVPEQARYGTNPVPT